MKQESLWTERKTLWTVRLYNPGGFGLEGEAVNVAVDTEEEAKWFGQLRWGITQSCMYRVVVTQQNERI